MRTMSLLLVVVAALFASPAACLAAGDHPPRPALQARLDAALDPYVEHGGVVAAEGGQVLYSREGGQRFVPASTLKIATAAAAIRRLGPGYRWRTRFCLSEAGDLVVRGSGDPLLVSEEWAVIARALAETGRLPRTIRRICLDATAFSPGIRVPGIDPSSLEPHHVRNGALAANFNTVHVHVAADGNVTSAEPQTPVTPIARRLSAGLGPGTHRVNLSRDPDLVLPYVGELLAAFLEREGHEVADGTAVRPAAEADRLVYTHVSTRTLQDVIRAMMEFSNNFVANQVLLTLGMVEKGEPATLEKGLAVLRAYLEEDLGIPPSAFHVVEGSGISRENRITPEALATVLRAFHPWRGLLSVQEGALVKTGTLLGVYTLAGYLAPDRPLAFVILLNQRRNTRDRVLSVLLREVPPAAARKK